MRESVGTKGPAEFLSVNVTAKNTTEEGGGNEGARIQALGVLAYRSTSSIVKSKNRFPWTTAALLIKTVGVPN